MQNKAPFWQGYNAAKAGQPSSTCHFPKPDKIPGGSDYPGPWHNWLSGWCAYRGFADLDATQERAELQRMTIEGLR